MLSRLKNWLLKHETATIAAMIFAFIAVLTAACFWKYAMFLYNGLDLAIIHQTFWNSLHGRLFEQTIHPHSYLGDHAELIILPLLPLYALWPDPRMLLLLQVVALALPAWPIFLIAKRRSAHLADGFGPLLPLLFAALWLLNPIIQNIALYEFHLLPFAVLPLLLAALAYERGRWRAFLVWLAVALLVREDVSLVVFCFGLYAWADGRDRRWAIPPLALGAAWFVGASDLIARFAPAGNYKFLIYYSWLGNSFGGIIGGVLTKPLSVLLHLATVGNIDMALGFLMPLAFLPLASAPTLILLLAPLAQILLGAPGGSELVVQTHYATLFLPALFLAAIAATPKMLEHKKWLYFQQKEVAIGLPLVLLLATVYSNVVMGPLWPVARRALAGTDRAEARAAAEMLRQIPADASVAAGFRLLPQLSSRKNLYSLHYIFLGTTQFAEEPYPVPPDIAYTAADDRDLLDYRAQVLRTTWSAPYYHDGLSRLAPLGGEEIFAVSPFRLIRRGGAAPVPIQTAVPPDAFSSAFRRTPAGPELAITLLWTPPEGCSPTSSQIYTVVIRLRDAHGRVYRTTELPLAEPFGPVSSLTCRRSYLLPLPALPAGEYTPELSIERQEAMMLLNGIRADERTVLKRQTIISRNLPAIIID